MTGINYDERYEKVMFHLIADLPIHKLAYVIHSKELVDGIWNTLIENFGIPFTQEKHDKLVRMVEIKLEGNTPTIEREWTEEEYNNFVMYKRG